jgi:hypothetical protein
MLVTFIKIMRVTLSHIELSGSSQPRVKDIEIVGDSIHKLSPSTILYHICNSLD